jgi:phosphatidylglycerophosphatase C
MLHATLAGCSVDHVDELGVRYAEHLRTGLRSDTISRLRWHQREGHRTVIVSASLRPYLDPITAWLGVDHVLCTELQRDPTGHLTGHIDGVNCRGPEKVARVRAWLGAEPTVRYAYGDSAGDRELLAWATHPLLVKRVTVSEMP